MWMMTYQAWSIRPYKTVIVWNPNTGSGLMDSAHHVM